MKTILYPSDPIKIRYAGIVIEQLLKHLGDIDGAWDLGCGTGVYLQALHDSGITADGVELNAKVIPEAKVSPKYFHFADLGKPLPDSFTPRDMVISFEVAEHLPPEAANVFAENCSRLAARWIVLTSSDKISTEHLNPQTPTYWVPRIEQYGRHRFSAGLSIALMHYFQQAITGNALLWFQHNIAVFKAITCTH